ncbi:MAG: hypothetical protein HWN68_06490 [Desulfobacterales bacterium]|nr:hypothetical protein [Desulfobacterales bacterium]
MDATAMVAVVLLATQFIKDILKGWKIRIKGAGAILLSFLVSIGVVLYFYIKTGTPITAEAIWILVSVFGLANGGKKIISKLKPASP